MNVFPLPSSFSAAPWFAPWFAVVALASAACVLAQAPVVPWVLTARALH